MFGKLVNDELVLAPEKRLEYIDNGKHRLILNPKRKHYLLAGYKEVEYDEMPEAEAYTVSYKQTKTTIKVSYVAVEGEGNTDE